jgi:hypothetical protein
MERLHPFKQRKEDKANPARPSVLIAIFNDNPKDGFTPIGPDKRPAQKPSKTTLKDDVVVSLGPLPEPRIGLGCVPSPLHEQHDEYSRREAYVE